MNLGGVMEVRDTTGGTILLTVDPDTGTVTIGGPLQANVTLNLGTITNTTIAGQGTITGTINNTRLINNGTYNNATLGTPAITGGTMNNAVFGTQDSTGGTIRSAVVNNSTIGTPAATGGTLINPVLTSGTIGNKLFVTTGANQSVGKGTLTSGSVTISTTAVTANSLIFTQSTSPGLANVGILEIGAISAGTSFNVHSSSALDVGTFNYWFVN